MNPIPAQLASVAVFDLRALGRWFALCALTGVASGLAAAAFVGAVDGLQRITLESTVGVQVAHHAEISPGGEPSKPLFPVAVLPLIPAIGGLIVGLIAIRLSPDIYGGGTDNVLFAYHQRRGNIPVMVLLGKWIASVVTLGLGGSAGREGPMTFVGGGIGSALARFFRLGDRERRLLLLAGAGAGVGAVFRVPLGSAIFAIEVLYRDGFEEEGIFPCLIASVSAYAAFIAFHGTGQMFSMPPFPPLMLSALPLFAIVGVAVAPLGYFFTAALRFVPAMFRRIGLPGWLQPCVGGSLLGCLGLLNPELLGIGYGWVQTVLRPIGDSPASMGLAGWFLLYALGKIVATSLTVGSGMSGGTFAPSVVAGGFIGGAVGQALHVVVPKLAPEPAAFALVGMGAFLGGIAHAPLSGVIIVCELAGNYDLLVPLMAAVGVAYLVLRRTTLYPEQVRNPAASPARAGGLALDALGALRVRDLGKLRTATEPVSAGMPLSKLISLLAERRATIIPVSDEDGKAKDMVTLKTLRSILDNSTIWQHLIVADAAIPLVHVGFNDSLHRVFEHLVATDCNEIFVLSDDGEIAGIVGHEDVARLTMQEAIRRQAEGIVPQRRQSR